MELKERVAIVTGAASGIGLATAEIFACNGAKGVVIADIDIDNGNIAAKRIQQKTECDVRFIRTDVSSQESVNIMVREVIEIFGKIDILVNNASICPVVKWDKATLEDWNRVIAVNLTGMYLCTKAVIPHMKEKKYGKIIFISSTAALQGSFIAHPAYGVSKAGIITLMKTVAKETAAHGIFANAVIPGPIDTHLSESFSEKDRNSFSEGTLLKRYGRAHEVAEAVLFLSSRKSSYITGTTLQVSGGQVLI